MPGLPSISPSASTISNTNGSFQSQRVLEKQSFVSNPGNHYASSSRTIAAETEAVKYFQMQLNKRSEKWVPMKSLSGHLSQASTQVRAVVGPQSEFSLFLSRHPFVFEVQGDLVSLRDDVKFHFPNRSSHDSLPSKLKINGRQRPLSMFIPHDGFPEFHSSRSHLMTNSHQGITHGFEDVFNSESKSNQNSVDSFSEVVVLDLPDYLAIMWSRQFINNFSAIHPDQCASISLLMRELLKAPTAIQNTIGWTQLECTEFIKKYKHFFLYNDSNLSITCINNSNLSVLICESPTTLCEQKTTISTKGVVFCVSKSWGIIDLGKHEHVFFDRSIFKHVADLTKHFKVGENLYFYAVLASKESRAKWHAVHVWKETDFVAVHCLQKQNSFLDAENSNNNLIKTCNCGNSGSSANESSDDSDSGVQENIPPKFCAKKCHRPFSENLNFRKSNSDNLGDLLAEIGVDDKALPNSFNVIRLNNAQKPKNNLMEDVYFRNENIKTVKNQCYSHETHFMPIMNSDDRLDSDSSHSDLNTMSDIPSITAALESSSELFARLPNPHAPLHTTSRHSMQESSIFRVDNFTQTYFTGSVLATQVFHDEYS